MVEISLLLWYMFACMVGFFFLLLNCIISCVDWVLSHFLYFFYSLKIFELKIWIKLSIHFFFLIWERDPTVFSISKKEWKIPCGCCSGFAIMAYDGFMVVVGGGFRSDLQSFLLCFGVGLWRWFTKFGDEFCGGSQRFEVCSCCCLVVGSKIWTLHLKQVCVLISKFF